MALTSRNELLRARRAVASRNPDLLTANGGGCNAILVRSAAIAEHRARELTRRPERRVVHGVRLAGGCWIVNVHASTHPREQVRADVALAAATAIGWAGGAPLVFGGDLNTRAPEVPLLHVAGHHVDHLYTDGRPALGEPERPAAGSLSDHEPLLVRI